MTDNITKEKLTQDIKNIGVREGDLLVVHSSMKKIGWMDGGLHTLTDALLDALGDDGAFVVPTHTCSFIEMGAAPYEADKTETGIGAFPSAIMAHPLSKRSAQASHSDAGIGRNSAVVSYLIDNHDPENALGYESPLNRISRAENGKILLIGVTHKANTSVHLAESVAGIYTHLHYNKAWGDWVHTKLPDGTVKKYKQSQFPGCSSDFDVIEDLLIAKDLIKFGKIGNADSRLIDAGGMIAAVSEMVKNQPEILMCSNPGCPCCPPRREFVRTHVL